MQKQQNMQIFYIFLIYAVGVLTSTDIYCIRMRADVQHSNAGNNLSKNQRLFAEYSKKLDKLLVSNKNLSQMMLHNKVEILLVIECISENKDDAAYENNDHRIHFPSIEYYVELLQKFNDRNKQNYGNTIDHNSYTESDIKDIELLMMRTMLQCASAKEQTLVVPTKKTYADFEHYVTHKEKIFAAFDEHVCKFDKNYEDATDE